MFKKYSLLPNFEIMKNKIIEIERKRKFIVLDGFQLLFSDELN